MALKNPARQLRELLARPQMLIAPGAYDCITARMVEQALAKDPLQRPELSSIIDYLQAPYDETEDLDAEAWRQPATPRTAPRSRGMLVGSLVAIGVGVGAGIAVGRILAGG